ncbi:hypothetical protein TNCV_4123341 [Trichonephila clavipes]|nr:hypothetical protein TNCV_4123341 [Trichonephila clavipes]
MEELEAAIAKMNPGKALGPDVIFGRMVQHFEILQKKNYWKFLTFHGLLANCPKSGTFHRHSNFETKQECFRVQNYRPIPSPAPCKLMERIIHRRLMNWLIENKSFTSIKQLSEPIIVLPTSSLPEPVDN